MAQVQQVSVAQLHFPAHAQGRIPLNKTPQDHDNLRTWPMCPQKGCIAEHIEISPTVMALMLYDRRTAPVVHTAIRAPANRTIQEPLMKILNQVGVTPILVQQIVNRVYHTNILTSKIRKQPIRNMSQMVSRFIYWMIYQPTS